MLSDLAQYFTKTDTSIFDYSEDCDLVNFLMYIYKNTLNDGFKNGIAKDVIFKPDGFYEAFEVFSSSIFDGNYHLEDALEHVNARKNIFLELLFSTIFSENQASLTYVDYEFSVMLGLDPNKRDGSYEIASYEKFHINRKIDKYINDFILKEMEGWSEGDGTIEENTADMTRVIIGTIHFKDKSYARKLRKLYSKSIIVRNAFNELNMYMHNGCFIILFIYNVEDWGYSGYDFMNVENIIEGFTTIRSQLGIEDFNQISRSLSIGFQKLNFSLYQDNHTANYGNTFTKSLIINLIKKISPPSKEVIL